MIGKPWRMVVREYTGKPAFMGWEGIRMGDWCNELSCDLCHELWPRGRRAKSSCYHLRLRVKRSKPRGLAVMIRGANEDFE